MVILQIENVGLVGPDCTAGGDHLKLAEMAYQEFVVDNRTLSCSKHCLACDLWVDLSFNGVPPRWEAAMVDLLRPSSF
jgi:hypothetical protein